MLIRTIEIDDQGKSTPEELITFRGSGVRFKSNSGSEWLLDFKKVPEGWLTVGGQEVEEGHTEMLAPGDESDLYNVSTTPGNFDPAEPGQKPRKKIKVDVRKAGKAAGADPDIIIEEC